MNNVTEATLPPPAPTTQTVTVQPNWLGAFRGIWLVTWRSNLTWRNLPRHLISILALPLLTFFTVDPGVEGAYLQWTINFYLLLLVPLYCLFTFGAMIRDELQADTMGFLITRPLTRAQLCLIKYLCHAIWLQILVGLNGLLLIGVGYLLRIPIISSLALLLLATQFLAVLAYGALSSLFGLIHQRYMVLGIIYGFVVELGIGRIPTNINSLSLSHHIQTILANNSTLEEMYKWSAKGTGFSVAMLVLATLFFLSCSATLFTFREYHHSEEMQK